MSEAYNPPVDPVARGRPFAREYPMDPTDLERVEQAAHLARLDLNDVRAAQLAGEIGPILAAFRALARVDVRGVEPLVRPEVPTSGTRADDPAPSLPADTLLAAAPRPVDGFYAVPRTVDRSAPEEGAS